jgi:hypothetical protein
MTHAAFQTRTTSPEGAYARCGRRGGLSMGQGSARVSTQVATQQSRGWGHRRSASPGDGRIVQPVHVHNPGCGGHMITRNHEGAHWPGPGRERHQDEPLPVRLRRKLSLGPKDLRRGLTAAASGLDSPTRRLLLRDRSREIRRPSMSPVQGRLANTAARRPPDAPHEYVTSIATFVTESTRSC